MEAHMRYDKPGYGDSITWGPNFGHPNDPRTDTENRDVQIEIMTRKTAAKIRADIPDDDETAIHVADFLGRTINDLEIVNMIRAVLRGDRTAVYTSMKEQMEEAIWQVAEMSAIGQLETEKAE